MRLLDHPKVRPVGRQRFLFSIALPEARSGRGNGSRSGSPRVTWRLVGANNRALAVGVEPNDDLESSRSAVTALQHRVAELRSQLHTQKPGNLWARRLLLDDEVVAVSARSYQRQREAASALALTIEALAMVTHGQSVVVRPTRRTTGAPSLTTIAKP